MQLDPIRFTSFAGGVDSNSPIGDVMSGHTTPMGAAVYGSVRDCLNLEPLTKFGKALAVSKGPTSLITVTGSPALTAFRYFGSANRMLIHRANGDVIKTDESGAFSPTTIGTSDDTTRGAMFVQTPQGNVMWTNPGGSIKVWQGSGTTSYNAGVSAGAGYLVAAVGGAGVVVSAGKPTQFYQFQATIVNNRGIEGPRLPFASVEVVAASQVINVSYNVLAYTDVPADASFIRWYVYGGTLSDFFYFDETAIVHPIISDPMPFIVASTTFNLYDADVSVAKLSTGSEPMPTGLTVVALRRSRLWGAKADSNILYFSGYENYEQTSTVDTTDGYDGGSLELTGQTSDPILVLEEFGSLLVVGRQKSVGVLLGDTTSQFTYSKHIPQGVVGRRSIAVGAEGVYILTRDREVRVLDDKDAPPITGGIRSILESFSDAKFLTGKLAYWKDRVVLSFSSDPSDVSYVYYEKYKTWFIEDSLASRDMVVMRNKLDTAQELVFVAQAGTSISSAFTSSASRSFYLQTGEFRAKEETGAKMGLSRYVYARLEGFYALAHSGVVPTLRLFYGDLAASGIPTAAWKDYVATAANGILFDGRVDNGLASKWLYCLLFGNSVPGDWYGLISIDVEYIGGDG